MGGSALRRRQQADVFDQSLFHSKCCPFSLLERAFCSMACQKTLAEFYPQGVRGIRKAAKLLTAAQVPAGTRKILIVFAATEGELPQSGKRSRPGACASEIILCAKRKLAKRRRWRMKRTGFEELARLARPKGRGNRNATTVNCGARRINRHAHVAAIYD